MSDVVRQSQSLGQILVETKSVRRSSRNLRDLERVREPVSKVIAKAGRENLSLGFQAPESAGMHDAVAVALERIAVAMFRLRVAPASGADHIEAQGG
jgi:hypothetical protein